MGTEVKQSVLSVITKIKMMFWKIDKTYESPLTAIDLILVTK